MKKIVYGFIALAAVFAGLTSCDDTNIDFPGGVDENVGPINIVVSTKGDDTRVYYQHNGTSNCLDAEWQTGDKVLAISPNGTAYELTVTDIEGDVAHIKGNAVRGVTVQLVYQKDISKEEWDENGGLKVDFSVQSIDVDETGKYQIAPAVFAGSAAIDSEGQGNGELNYLCGIVKVPAVKGLPAGETITKISLWTDIKSGTYAYKNGTIEFSPDNITGANPGFCEELVVNVGNDALTYGGDNNQLTKDVFFAVPPGATLKQATVTTTDHYGYYFHNVYALPEKETLGQKINAKNYFTIDNFERYYFTVWDGAIIHEMLPVSDARKIQLARSNLYYDATEVKWLFEANPYDHRSHWSIEGNNAVIEGNNSITPENTCGSFYWANVDAEALSYELEAPSYHGTTAFEKKFFTNSETFKVGTETAGMWYTLTGSEWEYLCRVRTVLATGKTGIGSTCEWTELTTTGGATVSGYILFHDNYLGRISKGMTEIPDGCVFVPAVGCRTGEIQMEVGQDGSYWASNVFYKTEMTPKGNLLVFWDNGPNVDQLNLDKGRSIRLARNLPEAPANTTTE